MRWDNRRGIFVDDEAIVPVFDRSIMPASFTPHLNLDDSSVKALRVLKGTILKKETIAGLALVAREEARGCSNALETVMRQGAKEAEFSFEAEYIYSRGCCNDGMEIRGKVWGRVRY